jgi:hypothetical protein
LIGHPCPIILTDARPTANAGNNPGAAPIPGGTGNPIAFVVPRNDYGITKGDVLAVMHPDNSDSGLYKFRTDDGIFVHGA